MLDIVGKCSKFLYSDCFGFSTRDRKKVAILMNSNLPRMNSNTANSENTYSENKCIQQDRYDINDVPPTLFFKPHELMSFI